MLVRFTQVSEISEERTWIGLSDPLTMSASAKQREAKKKRCGQVRELECQESGSGRYAGPRRFGLLAGAKRQKLPGSRAGKTSQHRGHAGEIYCCIFYNCIIVLTNSCW